MDVIEVKGLVKRYGDVVALDGVSFDVKEGEIFAFLGPNGAGKTTTVEILECLRPYDSGEVRVFGMELGERGVCAEVKKRIGVLPQEFSAIERLTVRENIKLFANLYDKSLPVGELISLLELEDKADKQFHSLSGGLKQRVGIATALVNDPELVFLDEPTSGLDPKARRDTWAVLERLKSLGKTIFLTTHYMEEAERLADRVAIIVKGRIIAMDSPRELIERYAGERVLRVYDADEEVVKRIESMGVKFERGAEVIQVRSGDSRMLVELASNLAEGRGVRFEILSGSLEDVFLRLVSARITEEGELA